MDEDKKEIFKTKMKAKILHEVNELAMKKYQELSVEEDDARANELLKKAQEE